MEMGLTGNIACGKSTVGRMLEQLGAQLIDADLVTHELMAPGQAVWRAIVDEFGKDILNEDQTINRAMLGGIVFNDPVALKRLEAISHPLILAECAERVAQANREVVVVEAVKLVEAGWHFGRGCLWVVTCSPEKQIERMMSDRGMSEQEARARLSAQPPLDEKIKMASVVIDNSGTREETFEQVKRGLERCLVECAN